jgi:hypothetical protein
MVMEQLAVAVPAALPGTAVESATMKVKLKVPAVVGVP